MFKLRSFDDSQVWSQIIFTGSVSIFRQRAFDRLTISPQENEKVIEIGIGWENLVKSKI